ncbi:MAG: hypothetical protein ACE5EI_11045 [Thermodesulfobacteriota bacterium]
MENFSELLLQPLEHFWSGLAALLPNLLAMLIIIIGGLVVAWIVRIALGKVLRVASFDVWCDRCGFTAILRKSDIRRNPSGVCAALVFWFLLIIFLMVGMSALQVETINTLNLHFFSYLPRVISAVIILLVGYAIAGFTSRAALIAAVNAGYPYARLVAQGVRLLIVIITLAMALEQLRIAPQIVMAAFSIIFGGIVLAIAIALGVGGVDTARKMIEKGAEEKKEDEDAGAGAGEGAEGPEKKKDEGRDMEFL